MTDVTDQKTEVVSFGQELKTSREKQGLSTSEIASRLNLQPEIISALEAEESDALPAPIYVRGYIRSYARVLKLDEDYLIELYNTNAGTAPELLPEVKHTQARSSDKPVKIVTYLISFGLVLLLLAWWQSHFIVDDTDRESHYDVEVYTEYGGALKYDYDIVIHPDTPFINQISYDESGQLEALTTIEENVLSVYEEPGRSVQGTLDNITLVIEKDSWVEVSDSDNKKIYLGMAKTGKTIKLDGKAPFSVLLGFAPGVKVIFNGKSFDTEPFTDAGVARFNLTD